LKRQASIKTTEDKFFNPGLAENPMVKDKYSSMIWELKKATYEINIGINSYEGSEAINLWTDQKDSLPNGKKKLLKNSKQYFSP
jgi:hypothetical protein